MSRTWWRVTFETRLISAIGKFEPRTAIVRADTYEKAVKWAIDDLSMEGYETRNPISIKGPMTEAEARA